MCKIAEGRTSKTLLRRSGYLPTSTTAAHSPPPASANLGQPTHYEVLGVKPEATQIQVKAAFVQRIRSAHPDKAGLTEKEKEASHDVAQQLLEAFETLSDADKRRAYDASLKRIASQCPPFPCTSVIFILKPVGVSHKHRLSSGSESHTRPNRTCL